MSEQYADSGYPGDRKHTVELATDEILLIAAALKSYATGRHRDALKRYTGDTDRETYRRIAKQSSELAESIKEAMS